ncbi:hypothetical protein fugu_013992 [Takifugu bimaculatus]|uniref:Peptidase S1 domain-containing protein n=1 Tax=Takifugu bimaculatus TaxID=433685 RepID=A0A4Z2C1P6_9TELE|nr:hypothetical protein fugu_013992 [Takifugu bimaculatus]
MLLLISLLFVILDCLLGAPTGREVYRMPQSALKAPLSSGLTEPSCDIITKAQKLQDEAERSWTLSQACAYYQHRCPPGEQDKESCIRIMGESCSARVLQCSLLNTMQNLEPATQTHVQGEEEELLIDVSRSSLEKHRCCNSLIKVVSFFPAAVCGQRLSMAQNVTQPRSRIVGGSPAPPGSWPWLVNLQLDGGLMCGGVLVDSSWVVTAAHCFAGSRSESYWTAVVGDFDITKTDPDEQLLKVNRIIPHPKFNPKTFNNDIALVELTSPVVLSNRITPVCLPTGMEPPTGSPCLVAGWGSLYEDGPSADVVMEAKLPLLPQSTCKSTLGKDLVTNTMLCAGYLSGGIDSCQGDSGGPLIYQDRISGRFQLHGITSWGDGCGEKESLGSREPTCTELLKTTDMTEEEQRSEFSSLCHFYRLTCPPGQSTSACSQMAEDKCLTRFKKCQLRSFLQTLLDLLQRAEDYIRDKVDLTFFTQTLPQLVEHIYSVSFTHTREKRDLGLRQSLTQIDGVLLLAELDGAVVPAEPASSLDLPMFREVGPSLDEWVEYLTTISDDLDKLNTSTDISNPARQEEKLFLQSEESSVPQLQGEFQNVISALRSKLNSRAAPHVLHLDTKEVQDEQELPNNPRVPVSPTGAPFYSSSSSTNWESQKPWSLSTALTNEKNLRTQGELVTEGDTFERSPTSEDSSFLKHGDGMELGALDLLPALQTAAVTEGARTQPPAVDIKAGHTLNLHRKHRSLLRKRQTSGSSGKICPGVKETSQQVSQVRNSYRWVLNIPGKNLRMNFQEVLVDLSSKNDHGLYQARVRAVVGGRPLTFYSLVGLENDSFYRSVPRIIALALEGLKT